MWALSPGYARATSALREPYQLWRDAIAHSFSFFGAALFSIKQGDCPLEFFKHVRVGVVACAKNYLLKRNCTDLLVHIYQNESPCVSRQTEHNIKHSFDLL
jgi:hypothetical protein